MIWYDAPTAPRAPEAAVCAPDLGRRGVVARRRPRMRRADRAAIHAAALELLAGVLDAHRERLARAGR